MLITEGADLSRLTRLKLAKRDSKDDSFPVDLVVGFSPTCFHKCICSGYWTRYLSNLFFAA